MDNNIPPVNDGKGFYDNEGLCDTLINDVNNFLKLLFTGQHILFCNSVAQVAQKLVNLKNGINHDINALKDRIEDQKRLNKELNDELNRMLEEKKKKDGAE